MTDIAPLVSVIIPVYNVSDYLHQCLESVKNQRYSNLEILVIDDGSTDISGQICDAYALEDARFRVFHTVNKGLSAARNLGLEYIHGEYIFFLDSDDWLELETINIMVSKVKKNDVDIVACRCYREWKNKTRQSVLPDEYKEYIGEDAVLDFIMYGHLGQGVWNKLYRSSLFDSIRFPVGQVYEDITVTYKVLCLAKRVIFIPDMLLHYRMRRSSICNTLKLNNLVDWWVSRFSIYNELKWDAAVYKKSLLKECLWGATKLWLNFTMLYENAAQNEKCRAEETIRVISGFFREHFFEVVLGPFSIRNKLMCMMLLYNKWGYLRFLNRVYKSYVYIKTKNSSNELIMFS